MPILIHGNSKVPELQQKNVKSTTVQQEITPSEGYDGFNKIIVSPIKLQEKTATPGTSEQVITPDSTYDGLSKVTVEAVKSVVQATPAITVATNGLITALATQSAGYVSAGTKSTTKQMTTQAGTTINPGTSRKLAVSSSRYTTGDIFVAGDSNLVADNIKKGVSIFGVAGTYADMAKVYVAKNIKPTAMGSGSTNRSFEISASGISKLIDASNSGTTFPSSLYGVRPMAVIIAAFSQYSTTASLCEAYFTDNTYKYGGALYNYVGNSVSTTTLDPNTTEYLSCNPNDSTGNVNIYVYVNKTYNFSTSASHNIYLIY